MLGRLGQGAGEAGREEVSDWAQWRFQGAGRQHGDCREPSLRRFGAAYFYNRWILADPGWARFQRRIELGNINMYPGVFKCKQWFDGRHVIRLVLRWSQVCACCPAVPTIYLSLISARVTKTL